MLLGTSLNFYQNQRIFLKMKLRILAVSSKKTEILSEAQKNGKNGNKNGKTNHWLI